MLGLVVFAVTIAVSCWEARAQSVISSRRSRCGRRVETFG